MGYTDVNVSRAKTTQGSVGITFVLPGHRGHSLGLAVKLANHRSLMAALPECEFVRTSNADVNAHMNAVNEAMGYRQVEDILEVQKCSDSDGPQILRSRTYLHRVVAVLAQHQVGAAAGGQDVLRQVEAVDGVPDLLGLGDRLVVRERGVAGEVRRGVAEGRLAQPQEPLDVPLADVAGRGVDVDAEVEEVAQGQAAAAVLAHAGRLEHVEALDDDDVGLAHDDVLVGDHVVGQVVVDRRAPPRRART